MFDTCKCQFMLINLDQSWSYDQEWSTSIKIDQDKLTLGGVDLPSIKKHKKDIWTQKLAFSVQLDIDTTNQWFLLQLWLGIDYRMNNWWGFPVFVLKHINLCLWSLSALKLGSVKSNWLLELYQYRGQIKAALLSEITGMLHHSEKRILL